MEDAGTGMPLLFLSEWTGVGVVGEQGLGVVTLCDPSQPDLESPGAPCHGRPPRALDNPGEGGVVPGP